MAHCPLHNDNTESFSIGEGSTGKVLLHCFAGCSTESVVAAIQLTLADLFSTRPKGVVRR